MQPPTIFGIPASVFFFQPAILWFSFIFFSAGVVLAAKLLIDQVEYFYKKDSNLGIVFTFLLLPIITTIPEIIGMVSQSAFGNSTIGITGAIGSNVFLVIIASTNILILFAFQKMKNKTKKKPIKENKKMNLVGKHVFRDNLLSYIAIMVVVAFLIIGITVNSTTVFIGGANFSIFSALTFFMYIGTLAAFIILGAKENKRKKILSLEKKHSLFILQDVNKEIKNEQINENLNVGNSETKIVGKTKRQIRIWILIIVSSCLLAGFGFLQSATVNAMSLPVSRGGYGISEVSAGGLFLGISAALPEISSTFFLFKNNRQKEGLQALFLDNLFTFSLIFIGDIISGNQNSLEVIRSDSDSFIPTILLLSLVAVNLSFFYSQFLFKLRLRNSIIFTAINYIVFLSFWIPSASLS